MTILVSMPLVLQYAGEVRAYYGMRGCPDFCGQPPEAKT